MTTALEQPKEILFTRFMKCINGKVEFVDESETVIKCMGIYYVDFGLPNGSVHGGTRPALVVSNNRNNKYNTTILVIPFTSKNKTGLPVHVKFSQDIGLSKESTLLCEQIITIPRSKIGKQVGEIKKATDMLRIVKALVTQLPILNLVA